ncbi:MAG: hypothetical protein Sylvanvirus3_33 [Sylvanvirus sp.]|uniref:Transmembrane protein n=1 Tax=Sylvanvirus sp. TaxID=2487774 RepID=A0A3G5AKV2_9VIRU|nr:MAG: hypothetical protein Sylvanvirus3_33 [Sylvanvirus sp.]
MIYRFLLLFILIEYIQSILSIHSQTCNEEMINTFMPFSEQLQYSIGINQGYLMEHNLRTYEYDAITEFIDQSILLYQQVCNDEMKYNSDRYKDKTCLVSPTTTILSSCESNCTFNYNYTCTQSLSLRKIEYVYSIHDIETLYELHRLSVVFSKCFPINLQYKIPDKNNFKWLNNIITMCKASLTFYDNYTFPINVEHIILDDYYYRKTAFSVQWMDLLPIIFFTVVVVLVITCLATFSK